jgi:hypothetical protein
LLTYISISILLAPLFVPALNHLNFALAGEILGKHIIYMASNWALSMLA